MSEGTIRIGLGIITHRRPERLIQLLESIAKLAVPPGAQCLVLIAENDDTQQIGDLADRLGAAFPFPLRLALETERGIPFARNKVLDMAIAEGCDFLTFVDDDEMVTPDWLVTLHHAITTRNLDLVGGPIIYVAPKGARLTTENQSVLHEISTRAERNNAKRAKGIGTPAEADFGIYTNNWMVRLSTLRRMGTRFDESLRYTGGSDTKFYLDFAASGARTGWVPTATVQEERPLDRLTYRYHFQRCRDQETMRRHRAQARRSPLHSLAIAFLGLVRCMIYLLLAPFTRMRSAALAARALGRATGEMRAAFGVNSHHYAPVTMTKSHKNA